MEQSEKMIVNRETRFSTIASANIAMFAKAEHAQIYQNLCVSLENRFDIALLRWRRGESPVADMEAALATSAEMLAAITDWQLDDETLNGYGDVWNLARYIAHLIDESVALPNERLPRIREDRSQYADVALDYHLLDALGGREWRDGLEEPFDRLASKKRQSLAVESYRTYFALLEEGRDGLETEALVLRAETNYARRAKDAFYSGGPTYMGGGPDNAYVVDFALAAILKKIRWKGESIHKWRWG